MVVSLLCFTVSHVWCYLRRHRVVAHWRCFFPFPNFVLLCRECNFAVVSWTVRLCGRSSRSWLLSIAALSSPVFPEFLFKEISADATSLIDQLSYYLHWFSYSYCYDRINVCHCIVWKLCHCIVWKRFNGFCWSTVCLILRAYCPIVFNGNEITFISGC